MTTINLTSRYVVDDDSVHAPSFAKVFSLYCALERGVCFRDFCERHALLSLGIDPARFVIFGTINGFVRRVREFPLLLAPPSDAFDSELPSTGGGNANSIDYRTDIARRLTPSSVFGETAASMLPPKFAAYVALCFCVLPCSPACPNLIDFSCSCFCIFTVSCAHFWTARAHSTRFAV